MGWPSLGHCKSKDLLRKDESYDMRSCLASDGWSAEVIQQRNTSLLVWLSLNSWTASLLRTFLTPLTSDCCTLSPSIPWLIKFVQLIVFIIHHSPGHLFLRRAVSLHLIFFLARVLPSSTSDIVTLTLITKMVHPSRIITIWFVASWRRGTTTAPSRSRSRHPSRNIYY